MNDTSVLVCITFFAAVVNGGLGHGFSSMTVPVALIFYTNRILNPVLVLVEVVINAYVLVMNRASLPAVWRRTTPILVGLLPGVLLGSYLLSFVHTGFVKFFTYVFLLPLILMQAAGIRRPIQAEWAVGTPVGGLLGIFYALTTISGPPLSLLLNNQGLPRNEFKAAISVIRVILAGFTSLGYYSLGLITPNSQALLWMILPGIIIGLPVGAYISNRVRLETFRRVCMSFDVLFVGFGLSRVLIELGLLQSPWAYSALFIPATIDVCLLTIYFKNQSAQADRAVSEGNIG